MPGAYILKARLDSPRALDTGGGVRLAAENRLSADQLVALAPGDTVCIETSGDFRRPKLTSGTVVRIEGPHLVVSTSSPRGVRYVTQFGRRDGVSVGGGRRAELVNGEPSASEIPEERRRQMRVDAAYRAWARNRGDVEKLQELQDAVGDTLNEHLARPR